jgi:hypothetical protein
MKPHQKKLRKKVAIKVRKLKTNASSPKRINQLMPKKSKMKMGVRRATSRNSPTTKVQNTPVPIRIEERQWNQLLK